MRSSFHVPSLMKRAREIDLLYANNVVRHRCRGATISEINTYKVRNKRFLIFVDELHHTYIDCDYGFVFAEPEPFKIISTSTILYMQSCANTIGPTFPIGFDSLRTMYLKEIQISDLGGFKKDVDLSWLASLPVLEKLLVYGIEDDEDMIMDGIGRIANLKNLTMFESKKGKWMTDIPCTFSRLTNLSTINLCRPLRKRKFSTHYFQAEELDEDLDILPVDAEDSDIDRDMEALQFLPNLKCINVQAKAPAWISTKTNLESIHWMGVDLPPPSYKNLTKNCYYRCQAHNRCTCEMGLFYTQIRRQPKLLYRPSPMFYDFLCKGMLRGMAAIRLLSMRTDHNQLSLLPQSELLDTIMRFIPPIIEIGCFCVYCKPDLGQLELLEEMNMEEMETIECK